MNIVVAVILFSVIVLFHEFGHFLAARLCGAGVVEFSLGMGPRLLSHVSKKSGVRYSWKLLPFGGSCRMLGEYGEDEADEYSQHKETDETLRDHFLKQAAVTDQPSEALGKNDREGSMNRSGLSGVMFNSLPVWRRILIIAAGPLFNFLLAFIFAVIIISSVGYDAPVAEWVTEGYPLSDAGVQQGDIITSIDGHRITVYRDISNYVSFHQKEMASGKPLTVRWKDGSGQGHSARVTPVINESGTRYILGLAGGGRYSAGGNPFTIICYSLYEVKFWVSTTFESLGMLIHGEAGLDDVSGPVGVVEVISDTYEETKSEGAWMVFLNMLNLGILLSANLGVMNLLPFPALDGGRIVLLVIEAVRRKRISEEVEGWINLAGFAALMALMVVIMFNDISKIV